MEGIQDGFLNEDDPELRAGDGDDLKMRVGGGPGGSRVMKQCL